MIDGSSRKPIEINEAVRQGAFDYAIVNVSICSGILFKKASVYFRMLNYRQFSCSYTNNNFIYYKKYVILPIY